MVICIRSLFLCLMRHQTAPRPTVNESESLAAGKHTITLSSAIKRNYLFSFVFCVVSVLDFFIFFFFLSSWPSELSFISSPLFAV